jgi:hypothetical protein
VAKTKAAHERVTPGKALWQLVVDKDLRRRFKARCAETETTMSDQVEKLIRAWLEKKS